MTHKRRKGWSNSKRRWQLIDRLAKRDGHNCVYCGKEIDFSLNDPSGWEVTIEHLQPLAYGGTNRMSNLALAHAICNEIAGNAYEDKMRKEGKSRNNGKNAQEYR